MSAQARLANDFARREGNEPSRSPRERKERKRSVAILAMSNPFVGDAVYSSCLICCRRLCFVILRGQYSTVVCLFPSTNVVCIADPAIAIAHVWVVCISMFPCSGHLIRMTLRSGHGQSAATCFRKLVLQATHLMRWHKAILSGARQHLFSSTRPCALITAQLLTCAFR